MMTRMVAALALAVCCSIGSTGARAQAGAAKAPAIAPGTMVSPAKTFDAMLTAYEEEVMGAAKAMPAGKYGFVPDSAIFAPEQTTDYKGVRSFGAMVRHMVQVHYQFASASSGLKPEVDVKAIGNLKDTDKDKLIAALAASFAFSHRAMETLTARNAFESVRGEQTRATLAASLVAHGYDHYGQLVEYLRMNGIVPPASRR